MMAAKLPWFRFLAADWLSSPFCRMATNAEKGAFWDSLAMMWVSSRCGIEPRVVRRIADSDAGADLILAEMVDHPDEKGLITHPKLYEMWETETKKSKAFTAFGLKGAEIRWGKRPHRVAIASPMRESESESDTDKDSTHLSVGDRKSPGGKKRAQKIPEEPPGFKAWYSGQNGLGVPVPEGYDGYPKKVARKAAAKAYRTVLREAATSEKAAWPEMDPKVAKYLISCVRAQESWPQGQGLNRDRQYQPNPATWLNGGHYEDEPEA